MLLCANENVPGDCVALLRQRGHDVLWIREASRGIPDNAVLALAQAQRRVLITFDKDFGELVFRRGKAASHGVILFRLRKPSPDFVARRIVRVLDATSEWEGNYAVVDEHSIRLRPLP